MFSDNSTSRLTINKATTDLSGTYSVEVTNSYGKEESSASLTVKG